MIVTQVLLCYNFKFGSQCKLSREPARSPGSSLLPANSAPFGPNRGPLQATISTRPKTQATARVLPPSPSRSTPFSPVWQEMQHVKHVEIPFPVLVLAVDR